MATTAAEVRLTGTGAGRGWAQSARGAAGRLSAHPGLRAVLKALLTVFAVLTLTFFIVRLMPGNPIEVYINRLVSEQGMSYSEAADFVSGRFSIDLDRPLGEQYLSFLASVARGDLGTSILSQGVPVTELILRYLPWTLFAVGTGLTISFVIGIGLGLLMAYRRNSVLDHGLSSISAIFSSVPDYLVAIMIVVFFGVQLRWLPITQMRGSISAGIEPGLTPAFIGDLLFHAALPITTYILTHVGVWMLTMKNSTLAALEEDYVTAARARGLSDGRITTAYVGRNAVLPLFTQFTISAGFILGGAVFIETIFVYQGLGWLLLNSVNQRDYPVMQGIFLLITVGVVVANLLADLLYTRLDPRIGRSGGARG
ncbi:MAG: ABC transporter permease [Chloroflexota bacterium]|nr:ABC transporter permease [Chloroflexota bacterium]